MRMRKELIGAGARACLLGLAFVLSSQALWSQGTTGTILGVVQDETGAALPGARVSIRNQDTGITRSVVSDDRGRYHAPNLALGDYEVQAEISGFQTVLRSGIKLTLGREAVVDMVLRVGEVTQTITVTGEAPLVDTSSSAVAGLVDDKKIRDLPLNGRSFEQLAALNPLVYVSRNSEKTATARRTTKLPIGGRWNGKVASLAIKVS